MQDPQFDVKAWKQKVHAVDMALRTVTEEANNQGQKKNHGLRFSVSRPKLPFSRASSTSPL